MMDYCAEIHDKKCPLQFQNGIQRHVQSMTHKAYNAYSVIVPSGQYLQQTQSLFGFDKQIETALSVLAKGLALRQYKH